MDREAILDKKSHPSIEIASLPDAWRPFRILGHGIGWGGVKRVGHVVVPSAATREVKTNSFSDSPLSGTRGLLSPFAPRKSALSRSERRLSFGLHRHILGGPMGSPKIEQKKTDAE